MKIIALKLRNDPRRKYQTQITNLSIQNSNMWSTQNKNINTRTSWITQMYVL